VKVVDDRGVISRTVEDGIETREPRDLKQVVDKTIDYKQQYYSSKLRIVNPVKKKPRSSCSTMSASGIPRRTSFPCCLVALVPTEWP
jgi:hypothetical protein